MMIVTSIPKHRDRPMRCNACGCNYTVDLAGVSVRTAIKCPHCGAPGRMSAKRLRQTLRTLRASIDTLSQSPGFSEDEVAGRAALKAIMAAKPRDEADVMLL